MTVIPIVLVHDDPAVIAGQLIIRFIEARPEALQAFNLIQDLAPNADARWPVAWVPHGEGLSALDALLQHLDEDDVFVSDEAHDVLDAALDREPSTPKKKKRKTNGKETKARPRARPRARARPRPETVADPRAVALKTLHLLPTAPQSVIKAAYQALAKIHHPDRGGSVETMKKINEAYEVLKA